MKKLLIIGILFGVAFSGCNNEHDKVSFDKTRADVNNTSKVDSTKIITIVKYDTLAFKKFLGKIFPPKKVHELFGGGYHVFYLNIKELDYNKVYYQLMPEAASLFSGISNSERHEWQAKGNIFYQFYEIPDFIKSEFSQLKNTQQNYFYQIDITLTNSGEIVVPWSFSTIDANKFKPAIKNNLSPDDYLGFFPAILKNDYKTLQRLVVLPKQAIKRKVSGKVFVKVFFNEDGSFAGHQLIKGLGYGIDEAVINAIKEYPFESYSSGEKTTYTIPFRFGESKETPVDLTSGLIEEKHPEKYNNLVVKFYNRLSKVNSIKQSYLYNIRINDENVNAGLLQVGDNTLFFRWKPKRAGTYNYIITLDPEHVLNDIDRSNNIVRGKLTIK